jgi:hypothetical protein
MVDEERAGNAEGFSTVSVILATYGNPVNTYRQILEAQFFGFRTPL